jgi:hypothetical protein
MGFAQGKDCFVLLKKTGSNAGNFNFKKTAI